MSLGQLAMIVFGVLVVVERVQHRHDPHLAGRGTAARHLPVQQARGGRPRWPSWSAWSPASWRSSSARRCSARTGRRIGDPGVLRAVIGGGLYMTLIALFSMGVAAMLRTRCSRWAS